MKPATPARPVSVHEPLKHRVEGGVEGIAPAITTVDKLPSELPKQAAQAFGGAAPCLGVGRIEEQKCPVRRDGRE